NHGRQDFSRRWRTFQSLCNRSFDDCFMIRELKIIRGPKGHFVGMPSKRGKGGRYYEIISAMKLCRNKRVAVVHFLGGVSFYAAPMASRHRIARSLRRRCGVVTGGGESVWDC